MSWQETFAATPARRIALYLEDRVAFAEALLAAWHQGKQVFLPGDVLPATLAALAPHVEAFAGDFPRTPVLGPGAPEPAGPPDLAVDREHPGLVVFTSGTTGAPTPIPKRLRQLLDEVLTLEATFGGPLAPEVRFLSTVSHQHIYGLLCSVLWPLWTGRALTPGRLEYPEQLERALGEAPCVLISSPAHLKRLPDVPRWPGRLEGVFSSGGPLDGAAAERARQVLGLQPTELYGSSETGGIAWRRGADRPWAPLRGVEVRLAEGGTLEVSSPHLPGPGWHPTADRVLLDGRHFTLLGRADRVAKIEEKRVSLELVERGACATGLLTEARAVVIQAGERVTLGLAGVPSEEAKALPRVELVARLKAALATMVEPVAIPRRFRLVDALPTDARGKLTEEALRTLFRPERPTPRWTERTPTRATLQLLISGELRVLDGHFPEVPIVPGVAQLAWAIAWGREAFRFAGHPTGLDGLKFQQLLLVGDRAELDLAWNAERATLAFRYTGSERVYSSGKVVLSP